MGYLHQVKGGAINWMSCVASMRVVVALNCLRWANLAMNVAAIDDNGKGMDVAGKKTGLGLQIIRDRATKTNGTAEIVSETGKETSVRVRVYDTLYTL